MAKPTANETPAKGPVNNDGAPAGVENIQIKNGTVTLPPPAGLTISKPKSVTVLNGLTIESR